MKLPWTRQQPKKQPRPAEAMPKPRRDAESHIKGFGDLENFAVLRHHAVRALCGFLMDRHSACKSPHPFCDIPVHQNMGGGHPHQFIADVIPQGSPDSTAPNIIAIYLTRAKVVKEFERNETVEPMEYILRMTPADPFPGRKLVVEAPVAGVYPVMYGPIVNPVQGNYSTGLLYRERARLVNDCNPEPKHCWWRYWEFRGSNVNSKGQLVIPRILGLQVNGEWWIASGYNDGSGIQQVAGLEVADSPRHNFGLHAIRQGSAVQLAPNDESEYARVVRENLTPGELSSEGSGVGPQ